jgi:hypothetical protein
MTDSLDCRNDGGRASRQRCTNEKAWPLSEVQKEGDDRQKRHPQRPVENVFDNLTELRFKKIVRSLVNE